MFRKFVLHRTKCLTCSDSSRGAAGGSPTSLPLCAEDSEVYHTSLSLLAAACPADPRGMLKLPCASPVGVFGSTTSTSSTSSTTSTSSTSSTSSTTSTAITSRTRCMIRTINCRVRLEGVGISGRGSMRDNLKNRSMREMNHMRSTASLNWMSD
jgi:Predicted solute binding protein